MLDLDSLKLPDFVFSHEGKVVKVDPVILAYGLRTLEKTEDPELIRTVMAKAFSFEMNCLQALALGMEFKKYVEETKLFELLKNTLGPELFSNTTLDSTPTVTGLTIPSIDTTVPSAIS